MPDQITLPTGTRIQIADRPTYELKKRLNLKYIVEKRTMAGIYFKHPFTGNFLRFGPNLEYGDVRTEALKLVNILAEHYHTLVSRIENLCENERANFRRLSSLFRIVETA